MNALSGLSTEGAQKLAAVLDDGSRVTVWIYFRPQQDGWFIDVVWPGAIGNPVPFSCYGRRLVAHPNILRQYADVLPFGLGCFTDEGLDPSTQGAFVDGGAHLVLLDAEDVANVELTYFTPAT